MCHIVWCKTYFRGSVTPLASDEDAHIDHRTSQAFIQPLQKKKISKVPVHGFKICVFIGQNKVWRQEYTTSKVCQETVPQPREVQGD